MSSLQLAMLSLGMVVGDDGVITGVVEIDGWVGFGFWVLGGCGL